jgi:arginine N-succinyltransferase
MDPGGHSPFWDALAGRFFGMTFPEADEFNAVHGTQFIADLMPKTPIYVNMLPESARSVMGQPHPTGRAALKMLQAEGFVWECYIDIFDGGPTVTAATDQIRTVREAEWLKVGGAHKDRGGKAMMVATGQLGSFTACYAQVKIDERGEALLDEKALRKLDVGSGDTIIAVAR